jgi:hypothetical protein
MGCRVLLGSCCGLHGSREERGGRSGDGWVSVGLRLMWWE